MEKFEKDYYRLTGAADDKLWRKLLNLAIYHHIRFVFWLRRAEAGGLYARWKCYRYSRKYGLEISPKAKIAEGLYLGHPYNITVGSGAELGKNVNLHKGCTIGADVRADRTGPPRLGNNVWCGINSVIIGKVTIGDDVLIAPGAFVNFDVPAHSIVIGNPGTIHPRDNATDGYILHAV